MNNEKLPRVTAILAGAGLMDFSKVPDNVLLPAQTFGSAVHRACELSDLETLDLEILSEPLLPYLQAWRRFCKDYDFKFMKDEIEISMVSHKWGFRGTPDRISKIDFTLIDLKTSTSMHPATAIQCAAYAILAEENGIKIKKRIGVQLLETGKYKATPYNKLTDKTIFLSCLNVYNWRRKNL